MQLLQEVKSSVDDFILCLDENLCVKKKRNEQHHHMLDPVEAVLCEKYYYNEESPHCESQCNFPFSYL